MSDIGDKMIDKMSDKRNNGQDNKGEGLNEILNSIRTMVDQDKKFFATAGEETTAKGEEAVADGATIELTSMINEQGKIVELPPLRRSAKTLPDPEPPNSEDLEADIKQKLATFEQATPEQATPEQATLEQATPEQATSEQATSEQATPEQATPEQATPEQATSEQATPEQATSEQATPEQATSEQTTPEQANPEQATPEQTTPEQANPEQATPEQTNPEQATVGGGIHLPQNSEEIFQTIAKAIIHEWVATELPQLAKRIISAEIARIRLAKGDTKGVDK